MVAGQELKMSTEFSDCGHVDALIELGVLQTGSMITTGTGETHTAVILYAVKEGKNGRRTLTTNYYPIKNCPLCGGLIKTGK